MPQLRVAQLARRFPVSRTLGVRGRSFGVDCEGDPGDCSDLLKNIRICIKHLHAYFCTTFSYKHSLKTFAEYDIDILLAEFDFLFTPVTIIHQAYATCELTIAIRSSDRVAHVFDHSFCYFSGDQLLETAAYTDFVAVATLGQTKPVNKLFHTFGLQRTKLNVYLYSFRPFA